MHNFATAATIGQMVNRGSEYFEYFAIKCAVTWAKFFIFFLVKQNFATTKYLNKTNMLLFHNLTLWFVYFEIKYVYSSI